MVRKKSSEPKKKKADRKKIYATFSQIHRSKTTYAYAYTNRNGCRSSSDMYMKSECDCNPCYNFLFIFNKYVKNIYLHNCNLIVNS